MINTSLIEDIQNAVFAIETNLFSLSRRNSGINKNSALDDIMNDMQDSIENAKAKLLELKDEFGPSNNDE